MLRRNWLQALVAAVAVTVGTGCGDECVDAFDCRNDNGQPAAGQQWVCTNDGTCEQQPIAQPPPPEDAGTGTACTSNADCELTQVCNTETSFCEDSEVTTTPAETSAQIQAFLGVSATDAGVPVDPTQLVEGAFVTLKKPAVTGSTEASGFFLQAQAEGPAMFVTDSEVVDQVEVGDRVTLTVAQKNDIDDAESATDVTEFSILSRGHPVQNLNTATPAGLKVDRSASDTLVSDLNAVEYELISLTGAIASAQGAVGGGFLGFQITTAGITTAANAFRLRVPAPLVSEIGIEQGCGFTLNNGVMWRFRDNAQPSAFEAGQLSLSNCPAPKVSNVNVTSATQVEVVFSRPLDASSVQATDFAIPELQVDNATANGNRVTLTTATQTAGQAYDLTVTDVTDQLGTAIDTTANTSQFFGFTPPPAAGSVVINEVDYDQTGADTTEFIEIYNRGTEPVSLSSLQLLFANGSEAQTDDPYVTINLTSVVDANNNPVTVLPAGGYLVVGSTAVVTSASLPATALRQTLSVAIQNGPDGIGLMYYPTGLMLDTVFYGTGGNTSLTVPTGTGNTVLNFSEGGRAPTDTAPAGTSIQRTPNGTDTNDNSADFRLTTTNSPGAENVTPAP